jgi:DNA replication and repair protein RecF
MCIRDRDSGVAYSERRRRLFERMSAKMSDIYRTLSDNEELIAEYVPSWHAASSEGASGREAMEEELKLKRVEEERRGVTLVGPHRDEIFFSVNGRDARSFASQGQQRTIALSWKLAEVQVMEEVGGQPPVLLLDDVMSELDEARRCALATFVGGIAQTFMTTTNLGYFDPDLVQRAKTVKLA